MTKKTEQPKNSADEKIESIRIRISGEKKTRLQAYADDLRRTITSIVMELLEPIIDDSKQKLSKSSSKEGKSK